MVETLNYRYTTQAEVERIFSASGVNLRIDDMAGSTLTTFWTELIEDATDIINQYAEYFYLPEDLVNSRWVRTRAAWVAAYLLSQRRGNPALFVDRFQMIEDELFRVSQGTLLIPRLATREDMTPAMSNLVVNDRYHIHKLRVHPSISTGGSSGRQDIAPLIPYEWL